MGIASRICAGWGWHGAYLVEDGLDRGCALLSHCRGNHGLLCSILLPSILRGLIRRTSHQRRHTRMSVSIRRRAVDVPKQKQRIFRGSTIALRCEPDCVEPTASLGSPSVSIGTWLPRLRWEEQTATAALLH